MRRTWMMVLLGGGIAMLMLLAVAPPASAVDRGCSFRKQVRQGGYVFEVTSHPAGSCAVQIVEVVVLRGGKPFARLKADVDFLAETAWAVDLAGEGRPQLAVASRSVKAGGRGTLDVYWLEGNSVRRAALPQHGEEDGYKGQDSFRLDGRKIVRSYPVYRDGDPGNRPSGGTRSLSYEFRDGRLDLQQNSDGSAVAVSTAPPVPPAAKVTQRKTTQKQLPAGEYPQAAPPGFFQPQVAQPVAQPRPKATVRQLPESGYPRAAPPGLFKQETN